jgi:hypothetical protein
MSRGVTIGAFQVKVKPRPLVGTKTFIRSTERDMRDWEWSESFMPDRFGRPYLSDPRAGLKYLPPKQNR